MKYIKDLPSEYTLVTEFDNPYLSDPLETNAHFHTPYSFSAFDNIHEIFEKATEEKVDVLGINDFITTFGYVEFNNLAFRYHKFPLFCIEFMGLMKEEQEKGIRINDPNNQGRIYFCGKGLAFPEQFNEASRKSLQQVFDESHRQTAAMIKKLNDHLKSLEAPFELSFDQIKEKFSKGMVRERHIAKALRSAVETAFPEYPDREVFITRLFKGHNPKSDINSPVDLDNELRARLLKKGGPAFVEEDPKAFLSLEEIRDIILDGKGIPFYPVLLDDKNGNYTEFEKDYQQLFKELTKQRVFAVELIPGRNDVEHLKKFVKFFSERGFIITMGSEHNTPAMEPLKLSCRNTNSLDQGSRSISYYGACIVAAHQYLIARGSEGYLTAEGFPRIEKQNDLITLGNAVIRTFTRK